MDEATKQAIEKLQKAQRLVDQAQRVLVEGDHAFTNNGGPTGDHCGAISAVIGSAITGGPKLSRLIGELTNNVQNLRSMAGLL